MSVLSYEQYLNEAGDKPAAPAADASTESPATKVDTSKGTTRNFSIDGKEYQGVLTTYPALKSKQESMGFEAVGMISIPGEKEVYELLTKKKKENE
jgi:hypothetical protein